MMLTLKKKVQEVKELYKGQAKNHQKSKVSIEMPSGFWLVNGKKYSDCNFLENTSFHLYISGVKNREILNVSNDL